MDTQILEKIGLTRNQSLVYIALLKLGSTTAQKVMNESGLHKSRVYFSLEKLQEFGIVSSVVKDYKKYYQAVPPAKLISFWNEKKVALGKIIPRLEQLEGMKKEEINASIYKGKEGLKTIHSEMLKEGKDIFVLGAKALIYSELQYFMPNFEKERIKKDMKWICLWDKEEYKKRITYKKKIEGKVLPSGSDSEGVVNIFGSKVAILLWKEKYPTGFMIENKEIADSFRKWFKLIYDKI